MNKTHIALATALIASVSTFTRAEDAPAAATSAPASDWTVTGNMALSSDYRTRGISQTDKKPALSGGFDVSHSSGFYFGNWNSNIDSRYYNGANIEMDFYGGFKYPVGPVTFDLGAFYYYYPGSGRNSGVSDGRGIDEKEIYIAASYGPVTAKVYFPIGDFFSAQKNLGGKNASDSIYVDLSGSHDLGSGFGLIGHLGYQNISGGGKFLFPKMNTSKYYSGDYMDWKLGVTYSFANGFVAAVSYIDTDIDTPNSFVPGGKKSISGATGVFSLSKTF